MDRRDELGRILRLLPRLLRSPVHIGSQYTLYARVAFGGGTVLGRVCAGDHGCRDMFTEPFISKAWTVAVYVGGLAAYSDGNVIWLAPLHGTSGLAAVSRGNDFEV